MAAGPWGQLKLVNSPLRGAWLDFQPLKPKILASSLPPPLSLPHAPHLIRQELPSALLLKRISNPTASQHLCSLHAGLDHHPLSPGSLQRPPKWSRPRLFSTQQPVGLLKGKADHVTALLRNAVISVAPGGQPGPHALPRPQPPAPARAPHSTSASPSSSPATLFPQRPSYFLPSPAHGFYT